MSPEYLMDQPGIYAIKVQGQLDESWEGFFDALKISRELNESRVWITTLTGPLVDQAALHGTLQKLYALSLPLLSVDLLPE